MPASQWCLPYKPAPLHRPCLHMHILCTGNPQLYSCSPSHGDSESCKPLTAKMAEQRNHDPQHSSAQKDPCYLFEMVWTMDSTSSIPMYIGEVISQKHCLLHVSGQQDGHGHICCMCVISEMCDTVQACRFDQSVQCCSIAWQ